MDTPPHEGPRRGSGALAGGLRLPRPCGTTTSRRCRGSGSSLSTVPATGPRTEVAERPGLARRGRRTPGARTRRCTARSCGRCGCSPASAPPRTPTCASASCCGRGAVGLSVAFDLPTLMGRDSDDPSREGEVGRCGVAVDTLADAEDLFAGIDLGAVTTSMTINSPAPILMAMYVAAAEKAGVARARPRWDAPERHPEGVPGPEGVHLPAPAVDAAGGRRGPVLRGGDAQVPSGVGVGLPHPRGRLHGRAGARLHPRQRVRLRGGGRWPRAWRSTSSHPG